ncbi:MAG: hypothetical protein SNG38_02590 [Rikenellaceae bacterium]
MNRDDITPFDFPDDDREYKRRVEAEIIHTEEGADSAAAEEGEESEEERQEREKEREEEEKRKAKQKAREANPFWQFISGNWLILDGVTGSYRKLIWVAVALFLSVVSIFTSFHLSERYTLRERSVQLLRERSLEYQRVRFNSTSHSAIVKELARRKIPLYDMQESKTIIDK